MKSKKTMMILLVLVLAVGAVAGVLGYKRSQSGVISYVKNHAEEMTAYAQELLDNETADRTQEYHGWKVSPDKARGRVEFCSSGFGIGSETGYKGVYYSASDLPLGIGDVAFTADGTGWRWEETDGDNWEYTERLMENWFWFEAHF